MASLTSCILAGNSFWIGNSIGILPLNQFNFVLTQQFREVCFYFFLSLIEQIQVKLFHHKYLNRNLLS